MAPALRLLSREKRFAGFAIVTLAIGIGALTTAFAIVYGVLLTPLRYAEPGRLYAIAEFASQFAKAYPSLPVNAAHFNRWQQQCASCESGALILSTSFDLTGDGEPERLEGVETTWQLFQLLGVRPQLGRTFVEDDDVPGSPAHVVMTDALWRRRFAADPSIVGRTIQLNDQAHVVVGVLAPDFRFPVGGQLHSVMALPDRTEVFRPLRLRWANLSDVGGFNFAGVMRLRPGATPERAQAEMTAAVADAGVKMKTELRALLSPLHERMTGASRDALWLLFGGVGALLLIVCANLGHMMVIRASRRTRDAVIRRALGARRLSLFVETMSISGAVAAIGGISGAALAFVGVRLFVNMAPPDVPRLDEIAVNAPALMFAAGISLACGVICGLWPAIRLSRTTSIEGLRDVSQRTTETRGARRMREGLVAAEVTLSTVLVIVAALLGMSFLGVMNVDRGFDVNQVLTAEITLPAARYPGSDDRERFHHRMLDALNTLPGVTSAGLVSSLPLKVQSWRTVIRKEGDARPLLEHPLAHFRFVSPRYFETMGIGVREGRVMSDDDRGRPVAVVSASAAARAWPGESPVGKRLCADSGNGADPRWVDVVGVVADVRTVGLEEAPPLMVYVPYWDGVLHQGNVWGKATYVLRTPHDPAALAGSLRRAVRELDAALPLDVRTMEDVARASVATRQFNTRLAGIFAAATLVLACLGVYGAIEYSVACRTREIGLRMALGAQQSTILRQVLLQGMSPVIGGLVLGVFAALWVGRIIGSMFFGVAAHDPVTMAVVASILTIVGAAACWLPARRAAAIDPAHTLRQD
jgi:predicted permease